MTKQNIFICNSYPREYDTHYSQLSTRDSSISGVIYGNSIIDGFRKTNTDVFIISCVSVGHYPISTKTKVVQAIKYADDYYSVKYNNFIGWNQKSKADAIYRCFKKHVARFDLYQPIDILVVDITLPFINAALRIKRHFKDARIVLNCLDVPINVKSSAKSPLRSILKRISIAAIYAKLKRIDGFILLSEAMREKLPIVNKPYIVSPYIADLSIYDHLSKSGSQMNKIVYTGILSKQYNLDFLLEAFALIKGDDYQLLLAGKGDAVSDILAMSKKDQRVIYLGEITRDEALKVQLDAAVLVNPRLPEKNYTAFSFPSKTISYLLTKNPVVCYTFSSFPDEIRQLVHEPKKLTPQCFAEAIIEATSDLPQVDISVLHHRSPEVFIGHVKALFAQIRGNHNG